jgi:hypothetical protein
MGLIYRRGSEEVRLEVRDEIATAELVVICHHPDGATTTQRFNDHEALRSYLTNFERHMLAENWRRPTTASDGAQTVYVPKPAPSPPLPPPPVAPPPPRGPAPPAPAAAPAGQGGVYTLEASARCPHCHEAIDTVKVLRLARAQVAFTSALPRGGRALICPLCDHILSAELAGLL